MPERASRRPLPAALGDRHVLVGRAGRCRRARPSAGTAGGWLDRGRGGRVGGGPGGGTPVGGRARGAVPAPRGRAAPASRRGPRAGEVDDELVMLDQDKSLYFGL